MPSEGVLLSIRSRHPAVLTSAGGLACRRDSAGFRRCNGWGDVSGDAGPASVRL